MYPHALFLQVQSHIKLVYPINIHGVTKMIDLSHSYRMNEPLKLVCTILISV